ncbi:MAG: hypothetical protein ACK4MH_02590 [Brevundimonas sp.]|uniref:hypothetical protein n=1 Tax=Brevundimonas sp. TaxID=1871086 RepID=UPI00391ACA78
MAPRLKVFTWSDGFRAFSVATSSRPKALEAWGSKQDLFAAGLASELSGGPDYDAAVASPGEVVERGLTIDIGKISKRKPRTSAAPSKAKREKIAKLEAALERLDADYQTASPDMDDRQQALNNARATLDCDHDKQRKIMVADLRRARG